MGERKQSTPVLAPDLGLITGLPKLAVPDQGWAAVKNAHFRMGKAIKVFGWAKNNAVALDGPVMGVFDYTKSTGFQAWIMVTKTKIYKQEVTDVNPVDITGAALTGGDDDWVDFTIFNDLLIIVNGKDLPRRWDGIAATTTNLGGSPPIARRVCNFQGHVMMGHIVSVLSEDTQKIQWSDVGLPESWVPGGASDAGSKIFRDEPSAVLEIMPLRDSLMVYKEDAGHLVDYTGAPFTMQARNLFTGVGPFASRMVVAQRDAHFFVGQDRLVYRVTLSGPEPLGDAVRFGIIEELNFQRKYRSFSYTFAYENEIVFVIPIPGNDFPSIAYVLNHVENKWGRRELGNGSSATAAICASETGVKTLGSLNWDAIASSWDSQTITWDGATTQLGANIPLVGHRDGFVMKHSGVYPDADGVAIDMEIDSKMFDCGDPVRKKRLQRVHLYYEAAAGTTLSIYVLTTDAPGVTPVTNGPYDIILDGSGDQWVDINLTAKYFQFRFKNAALGQPVALTGYTLIYYIREET